MYVRTIANELRCRSGKVLRHYITFNDIDHVPTMYIDYWKKSCLEGIGDRNSDVRLSIAQVISSLLRKVGISGWTDLFRILSTKMDSEKTAEIEGAIQTLETLCQMNSKKLDSAEWQYPMQFLLPKLMSYMSHRLVKVRRHSIGCLDAFVSLKSATLIPFLDMYVKSLLQLSSSGDDRLRKTVCEAFVHLLMARVSSFYGRLTQSVNYMIVHSMDRYEPIRLLVAKFWIVLSCDNTCQYLILQYLERFATILLNGMCYTEAEISDLKQKYNNSAGNAKKLISGGGRSCLDTGDSEDDDDDIDDDEEEMYIRKYEEEDKLAFALPKTR